MQLRTARGMVYPSVAEFIPTDPDPVGTRRGDPSPSQGGGFFMAEKTPYEPFPLAAPRGLTGGSTPKGGWGSASSRSGGVPRSERA